MRSKKIPDDAEVIRTFDELRQFRDSFFNNELVLLTHCGTTGTIQDLGV